MDRILHHKVSSTLSRGIQRGWSCGTHQGVVSFTLVQDFLQRPSYDTFLFWSRFDLVWGYHSIASQVPSQKPSKLGALGDRLDGMIEWDSQMIVGMGSDHHIIIIITVIIGRSVGAYHGRWQARGWMAPAVVPDEKILRRMSWRTSTHASDCSRLIVVSQ